MLTLHKLKVYEKALALSANAEAFSASWGRRHAIVDHFRRASESIVLNIAEGSRLVSGPEKTRTLDYALGSTLECTACLDIARIKNFLSHDSSVTQKRAFLEIARMLIGLRKSWLQNVLMENSSPSESSMPSLEVLFHHEKLDVYQVGLEFMRWFVGLSGGRELSDRLSREVDKSATSVILNVAEGNGRYSELDHRRFLEIAAGSAVKAAVYLDIYQQKAWPVRLETAQGRELLNRIIAMLNGF
jgi:four helix bundle protein